jgi:hypothetical protein
MTSDEKEDGKKKIFKSLDRIEQDEALLEFKLYTDILLKKKNPEKQLK